MIDRAWPHFYPLTDFSTARELRDLLDQEVAKSPFCSVQAAPMLWECSPGVAQSPDGDRIALEAYFVHRPSRRLEAVVFDRSMDEVRSASGLANDWFRAQLKENGISVVSCMGTRRVWMDDIAPMAPLVEANRQLSTFRVWLPNIPATVGVTLHETTDFWDELCLEADGAVFGPYAGAVNDFLKRRGAEDEANVTPTRAFAGATS